MTFLGRLSDPFEGLSDLQLGDEKVTLNHLVSIYFLSVCVNILWFVKLTAQQALAFFVQVARSRLSNVSCWGPNSYCWAIYSYHIRYQPKRWFIRVEEAIENGIEADFEIRIISKLKPTTSQMWPVIIRRLVTYSMLM